jgi:aspartyl-tRNA(Asn)/glutamyl-tRNA(Gln) amidotransferase subunit B
MSEFVEFAPGWELVVGLEVHVELATRTKLFSASANRFGDEPNTHIDPVTLGLPGALPVLNEQAVELAMRVGAALNCRIEPCSFHRKNYFYPDMPKAYQISQYDHPLNVDGHLDLPDGTRIGVERAHLEEDTGKSTHVGGDGRIHGSEASLIDFNRAGVPLVEIVSRPDLRTVDQARAYVNELRAILVAVEASDAKMEEGSMRVDANVSVHRAGTPFGTRCEIKNVNSVRSLGRAIEYEARRQIDLLTAGEQVRQETRHWNETDGRTHTLRVKEDADDYRYFLEPDLVPVAPSVEWIERVRAYVKDRLPAVRRVNLSAHLTGRGSLSASATVTAVTSVSSVDSAEDNGRPTLKTVAAKATIPQPVIVIVERNQDRYAEDVIAAGGVPDRVFVYIEQAFAEEGPSPAVPAADLAALTKLEAVGQLTATQAKDVLGVLLEQGGGDPAAIAVAKGYEALDTSIVDAAVDAAIAADPDAWAKYCAGEERAAGALVGKVMKATQGKADGKAVTAALQSRRPASTS